MLEKKVMPVFRQSLHSPHPATSHNPGSRLPLPVPGLQLSAYYHHHLASTKLVLATEAPMYEHLAASHCMKLEKARVELIL